MLIRNDVTIVDDVINLRSNWQLEVQKVKMKMKNCNLDILNGYNPGNNINLNAWNYYINQLDNFSAMVGNFNAHHPLWSYNNKRNPTGEAIFQLVSSSNMCLLTPPRLVTYVDFARGTKSTLDLCLVSSNIITNSYVTTGPDLDSDHLPI